MSDIAVDVHHVWKRFHRGEFHDCLRDAIPAFFKSLCGLGPKDSELGKGDFWALKDINFQVKQGESFGIVGHNGAGKSTMLKILSKIIKPNRGSVSMNGTFGSLIEVGAGFHGDLTGRENIYLNATILGMKKAEIDKKFDSIVDFAGIEEFLETPVKRYSSGMGARLGFAVAAHMDPEILIVDEVLSVGDAQFQKKCLEKMAQIVHDGRTVLFVSHNMAAVKSLCSRAILIQKGEMVQEGRTEEIINGYLKVLSDATDLERLPDESQRQGDGRARIQQVLVGSDPSKMYLVHDVPVGGELYIRVKYRMNQYVKNPVIQVLFDNVYENTFEVNTRITPVPMEPLYDSGEVLFHIPQIPLAPGEYHLYVTIKDRDAYREVCLVDEVSHAATVSVTKENVYGYDLFNGFYGRFLTKYSWDHQKVE